MLGLVPSRGDPSPLETAKVRALAEPAVFAQLERDFLDSLCGGQRRLAD